MSERHALFKVSGPTLDRDEITVTANGFQVGRSGDNDLSLPHSEISRHHMRIYPHEDGFAVEDLKSSNGVWVNDVRIRTQTPHAVKPGDVIRAGPYLFNFEQIIEVAAEAPQPPTAAAPPPAPPPAVEAPPAEYETVPPAESEEKPAETVDGKEKPKAAKPAEAIETDGHKTPPAPEKKPPKPKESKAAASKPAPPQEAVPERLEPGTFMPRDGDGLARRGELPPDLTLPPLEANGHAIYPVGIPTDASNWLQYLPAIYSDNDFVGRYLLIFESILSPITWMIDNFDMYMSPEVAPPEWLRWMASWFDVLIVPELPIARQRAVVEQLGWLFFRRGTKAGLERLLTLYFGVKPDITEDNKNSHFTVKLYLSESNVKLDRDIIDRLIMAHKPIHATYTLEIE
jgi:phage tail-like protein